MTSIPSAIRHGTAHASWLACGLLQREIAMTIGTVKFFNTQRGFGFIAPEGGASDVFVHISAVEQAGMTTLHEGQRLSFDVVTDSKRGKTNAQNLKAV
jgi:CspA family cold shock protein